MVSKVKRTGINAALASAILLGLAPIFGKQAILAGFSPLAVVAMRTSIATFLVFLTLLIFKRQFFYIYPVGLIGCLLAGVVNGLGSIFYYTSLSRLDASVGQLLYSFYPMFVALWLLLDHQKIQKLTIFRIALSIPGVYLLLQSGNKQVDLTGALLMLGAAVLYALHLIINQRVLYEVPAPTVTLYTLIAMSITVAIAYLGFDQSLPAAGTPWWPILAMAFITFASRMTLFLGVKHLGELQTAMLGLGEVITTIVVAILWLGDNLSAVQWIGAVLLGASIFLVGYEKPMERRKSGGWLSWLNPPQIRPTDFPWQPRP